MAALFQLFLDRMGRKGAAALDSFVKIRYAFSTRKYNVFLWADLSRFGESAPGIPALLVGENGTGPARRPSRNRILWLGVDLNWLI